MMMTYRSISAITSRFVIVQWVMVLHFKGAIAGIEQGVLVAFVTNDTRCRIIIAIVQTSSIVEA